MIPRPHTVVRMPHTVYRGSPAASEYGLRNTDEGFTLLEVLIALVIMTITAASIIWAFSAGIYAASDIENVDLALNIAQANMEMIKNQDFADIDTDVEISGLVSNLEFFNFTVSGDVDEGQNPMQVDVTVGWNVKGGQTNIVLTTMAADY